MADYTHSNPHPVFIKPVKDTLRAALVVAGIPDLDISYDATERNGPVGARVVISPVHPPNLNDEDRRSSGGARKEWHTVGGTKYLRAYRRGLIVYFQVELWSESLDKTVGFMFEFLRRLPRAVFDQQPFFNDPNPPADPLKVGNRIEITARSLILPDATTNTAKKYVSTVQVVADGALWMDLPVAQLCDIDFRVLDAMG